MPMAWQRYIRALVSLLRPHAPSTLLPFNPSDAFGSLILPYQPWYHSPSLIMCFLSLDVPFLGQARSKWTSLVHCDDARSASKNIELPFFHDKKLISHVRDHLIRGDFEHDKVCRHRGHFFTLCMRASLLVTSFVMQDDLTLAVKSNTPVKVCGTVEVLCVSR